MTQRRGFTLAELALVVGIIAVASAIAIPRYGSAIARYRLDMAARRIAADIALTRDFARQSSAGKAITFDIARNQYQTPGLTDLSKSSTTYSLVLSDRPYLARLVSASFASGSTSCAFDGYGRPAGAGTVVVKVGAMTRTISVAAESGEATVN